MTHPRPWLENESAPLRELELLRNAKPPRALDRITRERSRRRVAALGALPAAAGAFFLMQHVALGALVGSALLASASLTGLIGHDQAKPRVVTTRVAPKPQRAPAVQAPPVIAPPQPVEEPPRAAPLPAVAAFPPLKNEVSAEAADLKLEAKLLERARSSLASDPAGTLTLLANHEDQFRGGALRVEREFLRVAALMRLGRAAEAKERATRLRALHPGNLYEERLRQVLGEKRDLPSSP